jgi:dolichol-phosphate mannosyltransferase
VEAMAPISTAKPEVRLVTVSPLANEESTIDEFLNRVLAQLSASDRLLCVLDNMSRDGTRGRIEAKSAADPRLKLVWAPECRCVVDAYFAGYRAALELDPQWILEMDGGLSHIPEQIPQFIAAMESGADFAAGSRFCKGGHFQGRITRYMLSRGGTFLANTLLGTKMKDMTSGYECFSRRAMRLVVSRGVKSRAHFFQTEIRHMLRNWNWVEVPITYESPSNSVGKDTIVEALRNLWNLRKAAQHESVTSIEQQQETLCSKLDS